METTGLLRDRRTRSSSAAALLGVRCAEKIMTPVSDWRPPLLRLSLMQSKPERPEAADGSAVANKRRVRPRVAERAFRGVARPIQSQRN